MEVVALALLLPMIWLAMLPLGTVPATAKPPTWSLRPAKSSVPLVVAVPNVTAPELGTELLAPNFNVPA